jgi:hypothetical protein
MNPSDNLFHAFNSPETSTGALGHQMLGELTPRLN